MENEACSLVCGSKAVKAACEELCIDIPQVLEPAKWPECCIYRVPEKLYEVNKEAYTPRLVAIGPFHHGRKELKNMEIQKLRYLREFCFRTEKTQNELVRYVENMEVKIRHYYSENFEMSSKEFVDMVVLDGIFIINLFWRNDQNKHDHISSTPWLRDGIRRDLVLLENQLPFFVLEKLHKFSSSLNHGEEGNKIEEQEKDKKEQDASFVKLSCSYFSHLLQQEESIIREAHLLQQKESIIRGQVKHFTDLARHLLYPLDKHDEKPSHKLCDWARRLLCRSDRHDEKSSHNLYPASKLEDMGLNFQKTKGSLLDIKFQESKYLECFPCLDLSWLLTCLPYFKRVPVLKRMQRIIEVPPLVVDDDTEALMRNLMALEQCHYPSEAYVCSYVVLLDALIDAEKDVDLLIEKKIIVNNVGSSKTVAELFNKLCLHIVLEKPHYLRLIERLNAHGEGAVNNVMAGLKNTYFRDFWRGTATIVGLVVFLSQLRDLIKGLKI